MKRLISSFVAALTFAVLSSSQALAAHFWQVEMFQPTGAISSNSFNIEYKVLSVEKNDDFTIRLFQNDAVIGTQNTTKDYGDSGVFTVSVPGPGSYRYHVSATIVGGEGETKATPDRTLTVSAAPSGTVTTVFVNQANAGGGNNAGIQDGGGAGAGNTQAGVDGAPAGTPAGGNNSGAGDVAGSTIGPYGQVNAPGDSSTDQNGGVLGADKENNGKIFDSWQWWLLGTLGALAALGTSGYFYIQRTGNNPFNRD